MRFVRAVGFLRFKNETFIACYGAYVSRGVSCLGAMVQAFAYKTREHGLSLIETTVWELQGSEKARKSITTPLIVTYNKQNQNDKPNPPAAEPTCPKMLHGATEENPRSTCYRSLIRCCCFNFC